MINLSHAKSLVSLGKTMIMAHRPELLFGASVVSTVGSVIAAARGGYQARGIVDQEIARRDAANEQEPALTTKEMAQLTWKCYIPAAVGTVGALGSTTGLHIVHIHEKKALAASALMAIEEVKEEAKKFEKENLGILSNEEKEKVLEERANENGVAEIQNTDGEIEELYLVRDARTGRDIWSNQHRIEDALIEVNNVINGSGECEIAHFYNHAGFAAIPDGIKYGWSGALVSVEWDDAHRDDGRPVRVFTFRPQPSTGYDSAHG